MKTGIGGEEGGSGLMGRGRWVEEVSTRVQSR